MKAMKPVDLARLIWRRKLWVAVPMALGAAAALVAWQLMPPLYRASTLIMVESQKIPSSYVKATVTTSLQERFQTLEQQITNRTNLARIVREMNLYPELVEAGQMGAAIARVRRDLALQVQNRRILRVFFRGRDPKVVADTANFIGKLFIEENLRLRESQAQGTSEFLEAELKDTKLRLEEQEARVARFRILHEGSLPDQRNTNLAALAHLETKLEINLDAIENSEMRKLLLEREGGGAPGVAPPSAGSRLRELRLELARLRARYTDRHPDVVRLQQEIAALERETRGEDPASSASGTDPVRAAELRAVALDLERLEEERGKILADIERYQRRLEEIPRVEQELLILTRDYENVRRSYQSLLAKRLEARLAENLELARQGEQFRILEEAQPPSQPYAPNPLLLLLLGVGSGTVLGVAMVFLREEFDKSYLDADALEDAFPAVPVVASIPFLRVEPGADDLRERSA